MCADCKKKMTWVLLREFNHVFSSVKYMVARCILTSMQSISDLFYNMLISYIFDYIKRSDFNIITSSWLLAIQKSEVKFH